MDQHLPDPDQPITVSNLRETLEALEALGYGDTPISLYSRPASTRLIQAHNLDADTSISNHPHAPDRGFCSTWDITNQGDTVTSFVIL